MITAEEFLESKGLKGVGNLLVRQNSEYSENGTQKLMIEFAKMHVEAALKDASIFAGISKDGGKVVYLEHFNEKCGTWTINEDSILNAYPLENIV